MKKVTIKELVEKYVPRQVIKSKNFFYCVCPMPGHTEITPSFSFKEETFHCFGCGKSGNAINFMQYVYNLSYEEALNKLSLDFCDNENDKKDN